MKYLYVDTSSNFLYSGIVENNKILAEIKEEFGQNLSEVALPKIVELFDKMQKEIDTLKMSEEEWLDNTIGGNNEK